MSRCDECRGRRLPFISARAAYEYAGPARSLVRALKYSGQRRLAGMMCDLTCGDTELTAMSKGATLTFVPMHRSRQFDRGYNQAELYARALARRLGLPCRELLLKRSPTGPQNRLDSWQRKHNLAGNFSAARVDCGISGRVVLVDDVYTTGSTAAEATRVLSGDLGLEVDVWTFARTVRR
jgi:ComF family protein